MVLLLVPRVVAVELGMKLFSICFHIQLPPPPPEKGVTEHVCHRDRKKGFKYFFFMTLGSPSSEPQQSVLLKL